MIETPSTSAAQGGNHATCRHILLHTAHAAPLPHQTFGGASHEWPRPVHRATREYAAMLFGMAMVFLSYRREDSRADTGRLYDHLSREYGDANVFMDVDDIAPGDDFVDQLAATLKHCDVLIAVIGPAWLTPETADGRPRLGQADDFLTVEIATALARGITLIPVLVGDANMPAPNDLPAALEALARQQGISIRHERFRDDVAALIAAINRSASGRRRPQAHRRAVIMTLAALAVASAVAFGWQRRSPPEERLRMSPAVLTVSQVKAMLTRRDFFVSRYNEGGRGGRHNYEARVIGDDIVIVDHATGLMWQKAAFHPQRDFDRAMRTVADINTEGFAGYGDWRIPSLEQVASLITRDPTNGYYLDPVFEASAAPVMWTTDTTPNGRRWVVNFYTASVLPESAGYNAWLRLVRQHR